MRAGLAGTLAVVISVSSCGSGSFRYSCTRKECSDEEVSTDVGCHSDGDQSLEEMTRSYMEYCVSAAATFCPAVQLGTPDCTYVCTKLEDVDSCPRIIYVP